MKEAPRAVILRLPEDLIDRIDSVVHNLRLRSRSAFIRSALASQLVHHERQLEELSVITSPRTIKENQGQHNRHIRGRLQNALNLAPESWPFERLEEIEEEHMIRVEKETQSFPPGLVATQPYLERHVSAAVKTLELEIDRLIAAEEKQ